MKKIGFVCLGLGLALSACSGSEEDETANLVSEFTSLIQEGDEFTAVEAKCYAEKSVDAIGVDRINELGVEKVLNEDVLDEDEAAKLIAAATDCIGR